MEQIITSFQDALSIRMELAPYQTSGWHFLYRGHASIDFKLLSMVGRKKAKNGNLYNSELSCFKDFLKIKGVENWEQFKAPNYNTDLFYMSIGRHLGLDCRLLDWTASLETALFFAASGKSNEYDDGHLWIMMHPYTIDDSNARIDPFKVESFTIIKEGSYLPAHRFVEDLPVGELRRHCQNGFFSITPSCQTTIPLNELNTEDTKFVPIQIRASAKKDILANLHKYEKLMHLDKPLSICNTIRKINSKYFE